MSLKTKLLVCEYRERYPAITPEHVSEMFDIKLEVVLKLYQKGEIIVPSKCNRK